MSEFRRRLIMLAGAGGGPTPPPPLPYDAEVEYIGSTGTQYIDSGIECTGDLSVECEVLWTNDTNNAISGGIINMGGTTYFRHHFTPRNVSTHPLYWYQNDNSGSSSISLQGGPTSGAWRHFALNATTGQWTYVNETGNVTPLSANLTTGKSYGIMARISSDGSLQTKPSSWKYCKLSRNGILLRDYIAVRVGQVGYFYDKVSHQLFGNNGTGSFTIGADI